MSKIQLMDVTIIIASVEKGDLNEHYAGTRIFRCDLEGNEKTIKKFIEHINKFKAVIEGPNQLKSM